MKRREFLHKIGIASLAGMLHAESSCMIDPGRRSRIGRILHGHDTSEKILGIAHGSWTYDTADIGEICTDIRSFSAPRLDDGSSGFANMVQIYFTYDTPSVHDPHILARNDWKALDPPMQDSTESNTPDILDRRLEELILCAHDLGLGVMLKMHIDPREEDPDTHEPGYTDRARISFDSEEDWRIFFDDYEELSRRYAQLARRHDVEMLAFATELEGTIHRTRDWERIVRVIRQEGYRGKLLYAGIKVEGGAWPTELRLKDEEHARQIISMSDYIAPHYYGPLGERTRWSARALRESFRETLRFFETLADRYQKQLLIGETGMRPIKAMSAAPYDYDSVLAEDCMRQGIYSEAMQTNWITSVVQGFLASHAVKGVFWWDWASDYTLKGRTGEESLRREYARHASPR